MERASSAARPLRPVNGSASSSRVPIAVPKATQRLKRRSLEVRQAGLVKKAKVGEARVAAAPSTSLARSTVARRGSESETGSRTIGVTRTPATATSRTATTLGRSATSRPPARVPVSTGPSSTARTASRTAARPVVVNPLKAEVDALRELVALRDTELETCKAKLATATSSLEMKTGELAMTSMEVVEKTRENSELTRKLVEKEEDMRVLHNVIVDLKGQIRVCIRVRPLLGAEKGGDVSHMHYSDAETLQLHYAPGKSESFAFNNVYSPAVRQSLIFDDVKELIMSSLHGYNVSIIAYGQTGSGKTFTMRGGDDELAGLIPRAVGFLYDSKDSLGKLGWKFTFSASHYEIYLDEIYDLLAKRAKGELKSGSGKVVLDNIKIVDITSEETIYSLLAQSDRARSTAATAKNETSSRSHAIFTLFIKGTNSITGASIESSLNMVDLAGSERAKETMAEGNRLKEASSINTGLTNLKTVIQALLKKSSHIPYRSNKLTHALQDSLGGGKSKSLFMVNLSPSSLSIPETKRTLEFARDMSKTHIGSAKRQAK